MRCAMNDISKTSIIICCAGMGTRLGIGTTKALVDICGKPLIIRLLEQLDKYKDIRIVVGFDAERVIQTVRKYRNDIMFVFNYDYETTGAAHSLKKALLGANEIIIAIDGDTLFDKADFQRLLNYNGECIAVSKNATMEPIVATSDGNNVVKLSKGNGDLQWSGVSKLLKNRFNGDGEYVYNILNKQLPISSLEIRLKEINTQDDYENAISWFNNDCKD